MSNPLHLVINKWHGNCDITRDVALDAFSLVALPSGMCVGDANDPLGGAKRGDWQIRLVVWTTSV